MRLSLCISVLLLISCLSAHSASKTLPELKSVYEAQTAKIEAASSAQVAVALKEYGSKLPAIEMALKRAGDIEGVMAAKAEIARFRKEPTIPDEFPAELPDAIKQAQEEYRKFLAADMVVRDAQVAGLIRNYMGHLDSLKKELLVADKLKQAKDVAAEEKRVEFALADIESKTQDVEVDQPRVTGEQEAADQGQRMLSHFAAKRLVSDLDKMDATQWEQLEGQEFFVSADPRKECLTDIVLDVHERVLVIPCPTDRWNTNPKGWPNVDYRGHAHEDHRADNGMPFMQFCYALDGGRLVPLIDNYVIAGPGKVLFAPSDREHGRSLDNNRGRIRVKVMRLRK